MVQGIDYTSVSPWARRDTGLGLVSVVYISPVDVASAVFFPYRCRWI